MKKFLQFIIFSTLLVTSSAFATTTAEGLNQLFVNYNKRFSTGSYVSNPQLMREFNLQQDGLVAELKKNSALKKLISITNDYDKSLSVQLYILVKEDNSMLGLYYEKSTYASEEERSYLRFKVLSDLEKGIGFISVNGSYALVVKGFYLKPEISATLQFNYLTDLRNNKISSLNVFIQKKNNSWALYNQNNQVIQAAEVKTWSSIFPPNGGVKQILLK
jgi:hypothetical protein